MNKRNSPLSSISSEILSLSDYENLAKNHTPFPIYEYISSGVADDITLEKNISAFESLEINPSLLNNFSQASTSLKLFNDTFTHPILLAPLGYQKLVHKEGELATAKAADAMATGMIVSNQATYSLELIAKESKAPLWFQLYFQPQKHQTLHLIKRAEQAGYSALVITVDAPLTGIRERAQRAGFSIPENCIAVNTIDDKTGLPFSAPQKKLNPDKSIILNGVMNDAPTWSELEWVRTKTNLPIIVKGILNPMDGVKAREIGTDGIIVSNHGGRTLDTLPASIDALPRVREALGPDFPILFDSGIRRGTDVFKALALGANAVLVGRPQLYALATAGALGVAHMLRLLKEEFEMTMALSGHANLKTINSSCIIKK
jgi:isopentenyl diphosphate isomerase/L-lactate dehydrogenase-like FMN-dependent dehydrogenase